MIQSIPDSKMFSVILSLLLVLPAHGSTAVVLVTTDGIALGTDGKMVCYGPCDTTLRTMQKVQLVHHKILIATVGLTRIEISKEAVYDFPSWVKQLESATSPT